MAAITHRAGAEEPQAYHEKWSFWRWFTTVDAKQIGKLYIFAASIFFVFGGAEAFIMRLQLIAPDNTLVTAQTFNQLFTMHGTTMIFLAVMPLFIGFINAIVPLQIGARDVAFPRMNALSFWLFFLGGLFLNSSWILGGAPNDGWFAYAPVTLGAYSPGPGLDFYDLGLQMAGIGTLMTGVNFLVTIINMRAPGLTFRRLPLFTWTTFITSALILFAFPPFTVNLFLLMFDRFFSTNFFNVLHGGNVLIWQQLFWLFGHPEVYILILPAFGILSEVVPTFSSKPLFGYGSMVFAVVLIGFLSFMVWSHHMFMDGYGPVVNSIFSLTSMAIAIPTGIKIFNWIATMWGGRLRFNTAMLWACGFIPTFVIGGMSGVMMAASPADLQYNDTYFIVAHFHYVLIGGSLFAVFAAAYYWFPKIYGRLLNETLGKWNFWLVLIGFNVTFFPMHFMGLLGMPRRVYTYGASLHLGTLNEISTIGVFILTAGIAIFAINVIAAFVRKAPAAEEVRDPWDGRTLEWALPSPAPEYNFAQLPEVHGLDEYWEAKQTRGGELTPAEAPGPIHMPGESARPFFMALGMVIAAYGAIFQQGIVVIVGLAFAFVNLYSLMFVEDKGTHIEPEQESEAAL